MQNFLESDRVIFSLFLRMSLDMFWVSLTAHPTPLAPRLCGLVLLGPVKIRLETCHGTISWACKMFVLHMASLERLLRIDGLMMPVLTSGTLSLVVSRPRLG
jgi:hypothetical protein